jgi:serine/threonine protein kinase
VVHTDAAVRPLVIKILPREEPREKNSRLEISRALRITQGLAETLTVFSKCYGWIACGPVIFFNWVEIIEPIIVRIPARQLRFNPLDENCYYMVSEYGDGKPLAKHTFASILECQGYFFELFHSLHAAHVKSEFHHNDLHSGNVLVVTPESVKPRVYELSTQTMVFVVPPKYKKPMIIDYGFSTLGEDIDLTLDAIAHRNVKLPMTSGESRAEMRQTYLKYLFNRSFSAWIEILSTVNPHDMYGPLRDVYLLLKNVMEDGRQKKEVAKWIIDLFIAATKATSIEGILNMDVFQNAEFTQEFIRPKYNPPDSEEEDDPSDNVMDLSNCMICGEVAVQQFEHAPRYRFCSGTRCAKTLGPLGFIVQ